MSDHEHASPHDPRAVQDPVCRHWILPEKAAGTSPHAGTLVHFCRIACKTAFDRDPERFLPLPAAGRP